MEAKVLSNFHDTLRWIGGLLEIRRSASCTFFSAARRARFSVFNCETSICFGYILHHSNNALDNVIHLGKVTLYLVVAKTPFSEKIYLLCPRSISSIADEVYLL